MATDTQNARKIVWEREAENSSETIFHGIRCEVFYSPSVKKRVIFIWNQRNELIHEDWSDKSQRQAEIQAEVQLKNLAPKVSRSKFNSSERRRTNV